jgi:hypothetical protein
MGPKAGPVSTSRPGKLPMQAYLRDENDIGTMSHFTLRRFY